MKMKRGLAAVLALSVALGGFAGAAKPETAKAAIGSGGFLKTDGKYIKKNYGTGEVVNLRGTNVGGWLAQEDWMSPLGENASDRTGWTAIASANAAAASNALDGDRTTVWNTGTNQANGQWFQVDLGTPTLFNRIYIDAAGSVGDYPRGYQILVSNDGIFWKDAASGAGSMQNTIVRFTPQVAKYIRVAQTGSSSTNWWSIAEFNIFSDPVLHNGGFTASATSTGGGTSASNALDGDVNTRWTSGTAQAPNQTFTIDLGQNTEVSRVLIDAGPSSTDDYARGYEVWGLSDGAWKKYASGYGTSRIIYAEFWWAAWMTEIRIVQTGSADSWWSIADIAIYGGNHFERTGWTITASSSDPAMPPNLMKDNNNGTRWSTGAAQTNGQWIQIDMGAAITFNQIVMDTAKNSPEEQDYPMGYQVQVSKDGVNWTTVATGQGRVKATPINFPAVSGRYMKITQTGSSSNWWSIGELNVYLNNDDYTLWKTLKSRFGDATTESIYATHQNTWIQESDLDNIASMGLNVIRLPIAWFEIVNENGTIKSNAWDQIDWLIAEAAERNIYTLIDLHTVPGGGCPWGSCGRVGPNPNEFWTNPTYQNMVVDIWEAIATRYEGNPAVAGYDLINEPLIDYGEDGDDVKQKSDYYNALYNAVRAIDPDHTIYIAAFFHWANITKPHVSPYNWQNVVYEIHPYEMPGGKDYYAQNTLVETQLREVAQKLEDPEYNVPVLFGEFSLYHYDDVWAKFLSGLNALHVSWTNWSYKVRGGMYEGTGGYWGYYNSNPNPVPIMNTETAATMTAKLQQFGTNNFQPNASFIKTVSKIAKEDQYMLPLPLSQTGWSASASSTESGSSAANAIDWNESTRWSSGVPQSNGQWFQVDLGSKQAFEQLIFETGANSTWDYARAFQVQVSSDGANWTTVAAKQGFGHKIVVSFDPVYAQYVRIQQTGSAPEWWSIAELHLYGEPPLDRSGIAATASSTAPGESTAGAIDADMNTRWSTGAAQANGQYIQLDFGKSQPFNRILVDAGTYTNDYMRGYRIEVSQDGANWTEVASGSNSQPAFLATFPNQYARYVKIVQTGSSSSWWSVADLRVYGELERNRSGWTASAFSTEAGGAAGNALDGNDGTRWSSGVGQADGQWFEVNMGSRQWFNHVVIDAGASSGDYVRDYIVQVTSDIDGSTGWPTNWRTVANGEGTGPVVTVNFPIVNEQFVRVLAKDNSGSWWSIHEFRVFE